MNNLKNLFESVEINFNIYNANKNPKTTNAYKKSLLSLSREVQALKKPLTASERKRSDASLAHTSEPKSLVANGLVDPPKVQQEPLLIPVQLPINTAEVLNPVMTSDQKKKPRKSSQQKKEKKLKK